MAEVDRPVLVGISSTTWICCEPEGRSGDLWFCRSGVPPRRIEPSNGPMSCLPLLERAYAVVKAECAHASEGESAAVRASLDRLVPAGVVEAALAISTDYWLRLALGWVAQLEPSPRGIGWISSIEGAAGAQDIRHTARRLRRSWTSVAG